MGIKVLNFWMSPEDPLVTDTWFSFGYTEQCGTIRHYDVCQKNTPEGKLAFHTFVFGIRRAKRYSELPWPFLHECKKQVIINTATKLTL